MNNCRSGHTVTEELYMQSSSVHSQTDVSLLSSMHIVILFVGHHLATKVFIGKLLATRGAWVIIRWANDERGSWANKIVARP